MQGCALAYRGLQKAATYAAVYNSACEIQCMCWREECTSAYSGFKECIAVSGLPAESLSASHAVRASPQLNWGTSTASLQMQRPTTDAAYTLDSQPNANASSTLSDQCTHQPHWGAWNARAGVFALCFKHSKTVVPPAPSSACPRPKWLVSKRIVRKASFKMREVQHASTQPAHTGTQGDQPQVAHPY